MRGRLGGLFRVWSSIMLMMLGWLITIILSPMIIRVGLQYALAVPALLLEKINAGQALKRSKVLTRGQFGRIFVVGLLTLVVSGVMCWVVQGPFTVAIIVLAVVKIEPPGWLVLLSNISGGVAGALTGPLFTIALVLLYYDIRVRNEAYDLQLMMAALGPPSPQATPTQPVPPAIE